MKELFELLAPQPQFFPIEAGEDNFLLGEGGTCVFIPANSFEDAQGHAISEGVTIELQEILTPADFALAQLQTTSKEGLLVSEGMFFINATKDGKQLAIRPEKELQIELPDMDTLMLPRQTRIFSGARDNEGRMNWEVTSEKPSIMVRFPKEYFGFMFLGEPPMKTTEQIIHLKGLHIYHYAEFLSYARKIRQSSEFGWIFTREFEERFWNLLVVELKINQINIKNLKPNQKIPTSKWYPLSTIYWDHSNMPLWYADSLAYEKVKEISQNIDLKWRHNESFETVDPVEVFRRFYLEKKTQPVFVEKYAHYLDSASARADLLGIGLEEKVVDNLIGAWKMRKEIMKSRKRLYREPTLSINSLRIKQLGWVNCDYFYEDPKAKPARLSLEIENHQEDQFVSATLLLNGKNMAIGAKQTTLGEFEFTQGGRYSKLPIGELATIVVLSKYEGETYLAMQEITIKEEGHFVLNLEKTSVENIKAKLEAIPPI